MKNLFKTLFGIAMAVVLALTSTAGFTSLAADKGKVDVTKAEFVAGVAAVDAADFSDIVFIIFQQKDRYYAYVCKNSENPIYAPVKIEEAEFDNQENCSMYTIGKYVVGYGELEDETPVITDSEGFIGAGRAITEKEALAFVAE